MKRLLKATVLMLFLLFVGTLIFGYFYVRNHGFSAREEPTWLETFMARNARKIATPAEAKGLRNPEAMTTAMWADAREHFVEHCSACHGTDGRGNTTFGKNMYPKVPDLIDGQTQRLSDGEIFYIISNGVRLTGMPAFGGEDSPESIWHLVSFIRHLPEITPEEIRQLKELAGEETGEADGNGTDEKATPSRVGGPSKPAGNMPKPHTDRPGAKPHTHTHNH
jgi:mono/diheme cytochrome c family protein